MNKLVVLLSNKEHRRIYAKISINQESGCWEWLGALDGQGYGLVWYGGRTERSHRVVYASIKGAIPRGRSWQLDHLCRNTKCCNPEHLELVTQQINILRGVGPTAVNARKTHCKYGHPFEEHRRPCRRCDSIRHRARLQGPNREYWLRKGRESAKRWYDKKSRY